MELSLVKSVTVRTWVFLGSDAISVSSALEVTLPTPMTKMLTPFALALAAAAFVASGLLDLPSVMTIAMLGTLGRSPLAVWQVEGLRLSVSRSLFACLFVWFLNVLVNY